MVLKVENLKKTFRKNFTKNIVEALKGISFDIPEGSVTGFLGANGAGKTTTLKCLLNLEFADTGDVYFFGQKGLTSEAKSKIGFLPERPYFYEYLTGAEFLRFYGELSARIKKADLNDRIDHLLKRVGLTHARDRQLRSYSKGMLQRIGIAQALIHEPSFIILDEPMTGLDPDGRFEVSEIIRETARAGTSVFFSSHLLPDAEKLCDHLVILKLGEVAYQGPIDALLNQVHNGYLVSYRRRGEDLVSIEKVKDLVEAQKFMDQIRNQGFEITELKSTKLSLEQAFARIAFEGRVAA